MKKKVPYDPRTLQSIFLLLFFVQLGFLAAVLYILQGGNFHFSPLNTLHWALPLCIVALDFLAAKMFRQKIGSLNAESDMIDRVNALQMAYLIQWLLVQLGTFIILTVALLFKNDYFTLLAVFQILYYSTLRPRLYRFSEEA